MDELKHMRLKDFKLCRNTDGCFFLAGDEFLPGKPEVCVRNTSIIAMLVGSNAVLWVPSAEHCGASHPWLSESLKTFFIKGIFE